MRILLIVGICIASFLTILNYDLKYDKPIVAKYEDLLPSAKKQVDCLAENIYYEAGHEPKEGKVAVALVTMHRANDSRWPSSICKVVREKHKDTCQFSWWCEAKNKQKALSKEYTSREKEIYNRALDVAVNVYMNYGKIPDVTKGAKFYHADYVNPGWHGVTKTTKIGKHIFYKPKDDHNHDEQIKPGTGWKQESPRELIYDAYGRYLVAIM